MKAPVGKRSQKAIQADIKQWVRDCAYESGVGSGVFNCLMCGAPIQQTTLYATVCEVGFGFSRCVGFGEVIKLPLPYCPICEPGVATEIQRTCVHDV